MWKMRKRRPGPGCAVWEITLRCNLNCIHCGSAAGKARPDELTTEESLDLCNQLKGIQCKGVAMMGGEPLTRPDWPIIAKHIKKLKMDLSIITNGFFQNPEIFDEIIDIKPELVSVSLDGGRAKTHDKIRGVSGSFERALSTINRFVDAGMPTSVITTVHKMNLSELKLIRNILLGKGIAWQIQMAAPFGRLTREYVLSPEEFYSVGMFIAASQKQFSNNKIMVAGAHDMGYYARLLPHLQVAPWRGCSAGIGTLGIQSNGNIQGCLALPDEFIEGNIRETPLKDIWESKEFSSYSRQVRQSDLGGACISCEHRAICKGGCSAVSHSMSGELHRDPYCLRKIEIDLNL